MTLKIKTNKCVLCKKELKIINETTVKETDIIIVHKVCLDKARKIRYYKQNLLNLEWYFYNECC